MHKEIIGCATYISYDIWKFHICWNVIFQVPWLTTPENLTVVTECLIQHCSRPVVNLQTRVKSLKIGDLITSQVWLLLFLLIGSANKLLVESFVGKIWQLYLTFRFLFINALLVTTSWVSGVFFLANFGCGKISAQNWYWPVLQQ